MARKATLLLILALVVSCSDETPTTPTLTSPGTPSPLPSVAFPAGTVLRFVSGAGGAAVEGAEVMVRGTPYETNENGQVTLSSGVERDTRLDIIAGGFLDRRTLLRMADNTRFTLWPRGHVKWWEESRPSSSVASTEQRPSSPA